MFAQHAESTKGGSGEVHAGINCGPENRSEIGLTGYRGCCSHQFRQAICRNDRLMHGVRLTRARSHVYRRQAGSLQVA